VQGHLGRFGFSGKEVLRRADSLSGGERARLALAILMLSGANLLVLDEPTNHLDVESIEALEDAIEEYDGTVILVSHDRELLRALTTRIWVLHDRHMTEFAGGFAEWEEVSTERAHAAAVRAAEDQALRQVHERQRVALTSKGTPGSKDDPRKALRRAQRELQEAEARVAELESQIAPVVAALEDPALYTRPDGAASARQLGAQLETLKRGLDLALERWTEATERVEERDDSGQIGGKGGRINP
jgi:ATP-binding cassette subfamily F protein 3